MQAPAQVLSRVEQTKRNSGLLSSEAVLNILKLILAGSPLPKVLAIVARLVESTFDGLFCTAGASIWQLPALS
jgi:formate hydrogenlyase transcriptional activator